ncbi:transketolase [Lactiplantibacillus fabifermentans T30PCM01]|uniref:Transketolase n=1 Tax=Lactiplantibacillus fabifermentans T30PCM01 TaxID=1400520 RepID=W6T4K6_9LACO|nr:transketolase C-terminal domain-containing protein [Lactiplantibacillus fabifermentans]ETY72872.1 transketolase [Lactiplantibacillus fabifermentans T30PCM01]
MSNSKKAGDVICEELISAATADPDVLAVTSDSRGSASLNPFVEKCPDQLIEMGIAEQNSVTVSAGLAHSGKRPFTFSPAAFLTARSIEQVKVDVTYSNANVKLIGISGGNSYSVLGNTHHSLQDLSMTRALSNLEIFMPADRAQTQGLMKYLIKSDIPAYVRIGKKALTDIYDNAEAAFTAPGKANLVVDNGNDVTLIAAGETVITAVETAKELVGRGINAKVVDLVSIKPLDIEMLNKVADQTHYFVTIEEHSVIGGLGSAVAEAVALRGDTKVDFVGFPDEPAIAGTQDEVFNYYGIDADDIANRIEKTLKA